MSDQLDAPSTQIASTPRRSRPRGLVRLAFRLPILLYRLHLDWLLGHRMALLTHRGRRTGTVRQTVLEVVRYDPARRECIVVSAWGERADWYRNLQASPALALQVGRERYRPVQRFLSEAEIAVELRDYQRRHPLLFRLMARWLGFSRKDDVDTLRALSRAVRMVALRDPTSQETTG